MESVRKHRSSTDFGKILHTIFDSDQPFTIQSPKPSRSKSLQNLNMISKNKGAKFFHSDQPFTIKNPANLNNIFLSIFHSDQSFKDTRFFIRIQRSTIIGFHSDQSFTIKSPANLNNIGLSTFHSDQSFKDTRFFIQISPSRIQRSMIIGLK